MHPPRHPAGRLGLERLEARETPATFRAFGAAAGGRPLVELFSPTGASLVRFEAFESTFRGGVRTTVAELDGDPNTVEVVAGAGPGGAPIVRVFEVDVRTNAVSAPVSFLAFPDVNYRGGIRVAAGRFDVTSPVEQVVVSADEGGGPRVRVFDFNRFDPTVVNGVPDPIRTPLGDFFAYESTQRGGVRVAAGELDGNPLDGDELLVGAGPGGGPRVRVIRSDGTILADYFAFRTDFRGGVQVFVDEDLGAGRPVADAFAEDPSQRNAALNSTALTLAGGGGRNPAAVVANVNQTTTGTAGVGGAAADTVTRVSTTTTAPGFATVGTGTGLVPGGFTGAGLFPPGTTGVTVGGSTVNVAAGTQAVGATPQVVAAGVTAATAAPGGVVTNITTATPTAGTTSSLATSTTGFGPAGDPGPANPFPILSNFPVFDPRVFFVIPV